jgi:hypothetical protein
MIELVPGQEGDTTESEAVLLDPRLDRRLRGNGVAIARALESEQVQWCEAWWRSLTHPDDHGFTVDYMRPERSNMREIARGAAELWQDVLPRVFTDHRVVMTTFVVKQPGEESEMLLHEDRSYVEEQLYRSYTMWIPLVDVTLERNNGVLEVVPRSHLLAPGMAGSLTPDPLLPFEGYLREHLLPLDVAAGEAVIYDTRLLHASRPNLSDTPRPAIVCAVVPRTAELIHVVATGRSGRRVHAIDERFFVEHHPREVEAEMPPEYPVVREYQDFGEVEPVAMAAVLGSAQLPEVGPVVPHDVFDQNGCKPEQLQVSGAPCDGPDLRLALGDGPPATCGVVSISGGVSVRAVRRNGRRCGTPLDLVAHRPGFPVIAVDVIALEPGARCAVNAPHRRFIEWQLLAIESPGCSAGVRCGDRAANPRPGQLVELIEGKDLVVWNDGPGQFVVMLIGRLALRSEVRPRR